MKKVHHIGTYVLPMPEGHDVKKVLYRELRRRCAEGPHDNRLMATRLLTGTAGRVAGARRSTPAPASSSWCAPRRSSCPPARRAARPARQSGYLFGTYENAANSGDGYAMAYHAGAELGDLECFQINPLIKDYNGPACAYVTGPFGGYTANNEGARFIECDYWTGQMMLEFYSELQSGKGPVFLKLTTWRRTIDKIETILHTIERPSRGRFHEGRGTDYRHQVEMHISEIGFCCGHSASGVCVDEFGRTTVPGLYAAGDMASVPHNYMLGAFMNGGVAGGMPRDVCARRRLPRARRKTAERAQELSPTAARRRPPQPKMEYKTRRMVNDYLQPPKVTRKWRSADALSPNARRIARHGRARSARADARAGSRHSILDCAEMAARASLFRTESRWGLYHYRTDFPERDDRGVVLAPKPPQGGGRAARALGAQAPCRAVFHLGPGAGRPAADRPDRAAGAAAAPGRRASPGHHQVPNRSGLHQHSNRRPRASPMSLLSKSRRSTICSHTWPTPIPGCAEPRWPR